MGACHAYGRWDAPKIKEHFMPRRILPLSELQIKNAKPQEKGYKLFDGGGLNLLVSPAGGKLWRLKYSFEGKVKQLSLGAYPQVTLADARKRRDDAKKLLSNGVDPGEFKKVQKTIREAATENSFEIVAREWHLKFSSKWSAVHSKTLIDRLEKDVFPYLGRRPVTDITPPEILTTVRRIESRGALDTAHRVLNSCGQILRYAVATGRAESDCTRDLRGALPPVKFGHRAALTDPKQLAGLLRATDEFQGSFTVKCALRLLPMLFVRPGELRGMEWEELDLDVAEWSIPGERMKMKQPHLVPLPSQAVAILKDLKPLTCHSKYVFPSIRTPLRIISENTLNAGLRRMGFSKEEVCTHGFRATARTLLHEVLGFSPDAIEAQLAHAVPDRLGRAYNRTQHLAERRKMMQQWADYLDGLKSVAKVIPIRQAV